MGCNIGTATYAYDADNRPTTVMDPLGNVTTYSYDNYGHASQVTLALTTTLVGAGAGVSAAGAVGLGVAKETTAGIEAKAGAALSSEYQYDMVENPGPLPNISAVAAGTFASGKCNIEVLKRRL